MAQHWSATPDDAQDAVQRALEIYMRRIDSLDPATELAWLRVVVKHEAIAIRTRAADHAPAELIEEHDHVAADQRPIDDLLAGRERVRRSKEALAQLKPDEAKALVLKAQGLSYAEIGEALGWSYTKVNRCITEGRARFLKLYAELEAGEACARYAPTVAALAAGTADADALLDLRPHLRNCPACRATVRDLHATRLGRFGALWPIPALVAPLRRLGLGRGEPVAAPPPAPEADAVLTPARRLGPDDLDPVDLREFHDAVERMDPTALHIAAEAPSRWLELKTHLYGWLHRMGGTDVVAAAQVGAGTGGGRVATLGAVIGLCLSSLGAGTACVVTGVIELPFARAPEQPPAVEQRKPAPEVRPEPRKTASREPKRPLPIAATRTPELADSAPDTTNERSHEHVAGPAPERRTARSVVEREFNFESSPSSPAPATATVASPAAGAPPALSFEAAVQQSASSSPRAQESNNPAAQEFGP